MINLDKKSQKLRETGILSKPKMLPLPTIGTKKTRTWFHERKILAERKIMIEKFRKEINLILEAGEIPKKSLYQKLKYWEYIPK